MIKISVIVSMFLIFLIRHLASAEVEVKYDRFEGYTAVILRSSVEGNKEIYGYPGISVHSAFKGKTRTESPYKFVLVSLNFMHKSWEYLSCHSVAFLIDGIPIKTPPFEHKGNVGNSYVFEHLLSKVSLDFITTIAKAKERIEFKVCNDEFTLPMSIVDDAQKYLEAIGAN